MERLKERLEQTRKALAALDEVLEKPYSKIIRDAAIQRFEFTLETLWKLAQRYIFIHDGIDIGSPKGVIRGCFQSGLLDETESELFLKAIDDRNLTVHTYNEALAEKIYHNIFNYRPIFLTLFQKIETLLPQCGTSLS